jgi:transcriptional regulator with XRE-family HTH domain
MYQILLNCKFLLQIYFSMVDENFATRLKLLADKLGLKQHNVYKDLGTSSARVSNVFNSVNNPSYEFLQSFLNAYPGVNANWLLTGEGEMFLNDPNETDSSAQKVPATDLRKRVEKIEGFLKKKFVDFE